VFGDAVAGLTRKLAIVATTPKADTSPGPRACFGTTVSENVVGWLLGFEEPLSISAGISVAKHWLGSVSTVNPFI
jgi:hypothetical protein